MDVVQSPQHSRGRRAKGWAVAAGALALVVAGGGAAMALSRPAGATSPAALSSAAGQPVADGTAGQQRADGAPGQQRPNKPLGIDKVVTGTVVSFSGSTLVVDVDVDAGSTETFTLSARLQARLKADGGTHPAAVPAKGDRIVVAASGTSPNYVAEIVRVIHPRVVGTVTAVNGDTLTVVDPQGFSYTVDISGVTPKPTIAIGDHIVAVGTVSGANQLTATKVTKNLRAAVRSEWPGWRGFHHHRPGTAPQQQSPSTGTTTSGFSAAA